MPIDPRIALAGVSPTYDFMGAYNTSRAAAQTAQANQMVMQAKQAEAELNRNAMLEARTLDPTNQEALRAYALRNPAAAEQVLGGLASADNLFSARGTEARAQSKFETEQRDSFQGFMRTAIASVRNNPSDENIDAVSAQAEAMGIPPAQMAAYAGRFRAVPVEQRTALLDNELATTEDGRALLKTFTRDITMDDVGGSLVPRDTNLLAVGAVMPTAITKTPDPMKFTDFPTPDGITRVYADGRSEILRGPTGAPLTAAPTPAQQQADAEAAAEQTSQANARQDVNGTLESMMAEYDNLYRLGAIVSTDRTGAQNVGAAAGASLPGRVAGRVLGLEAQTARDNIAAALPQIMLGLQTASGLSATQLNSNAELQFFKGVLGNPDASYQTVVDAIQRFQRFADSLLGGGDGAAPPAPRAPPQAGEVRAGYRFRGGDPGNQSNWTPVR